MKFALVSAGSFEMGSPPNEYLRSDDEVEHHVWLTKPFYMSDTLTTQSEWFAVMGTNPSKFKGLDLPVDSVSWADAVAFCEKLHQKNGWHYRLPTEAEFEYACRAGTRTAFSTGNDQHSLDNTAWFANNSGDQYIDFEKIILAGGPYSDTVISNRCRPRPVRQKHANAWGLYDMEGDLSEWCSDWSGSYPSGNVTDPTGPKNGQFKIVRGGCWACDACRCRCADRGGIEPTYAGSSVGFRVVRDIG